MLFFTDNFCRLLGIGGGQVPLVPPAALPLGMIAGCFVKGGFYCAGSYLNIYELCEGLACFLVIKEKH